VRAELVSATSIAVTWAPLSTKHANGKIIGYTVTLLDVNPILHADHLKSIEVIASKPYRVVFDGLRFHTTYHAYVNAQTLMGNGPSNNSSEESTARTADTGSNLIFF
jgi:hypothetical protein